MPCEEVVSIPEHLSDAVRLFWCGDAVTANERATDAPHAVTVVTAFFDIGRAAWTVGASAASPFRRTTELYLAHFAHLARLPNDLIVFTDPAVAPAVLDLRRGAGLEDRTTIFTIEDLFGEPAVAALTRAVAARMTDDFRRIVWHPEAPEYNEPKYVVVNALKSSFVCTALALDVVATSEVAWLDFGYCRSEGRFDASATWRFDTEGKMNLFHVAPIEGASVLHAVRTGTVYFQGCHIVGPASEWPWFNRALSAAMTSLLDVDLIDDDQTLLLMAWRRAPERCRTLPIDPADWFVVLRRRFDEEDLTATPQAAVPALTARTELAVLFDTHVRKRLRRWIRTHLRLRRAGRP